MFNKKKKFTHRRRVILLYETIWSVEYYSYVQDNIKKKEELSNPLPSSS